MRRLITSASSFRDRNRASRQERRAILRLIRQKRKIMRRKARRLRKLGYKVRARDLMRNFRRNIRMLRLEKRMGLFGFLVRRKKRKKRRKPSLTLPGFKSEPKNPNESQIKLGASEMQEITPPLAQEVIKTPSSANTSSPSVSAGGGGSASESSTAQQSPEPEKSEEQENTDKGQKSKTNKKSKKWLWAGVALLAIGIVLFSNSKK